MDNIGNFKNSILVSLMQWRRKLACRKTSLLKLEQLEKTDKNVFYLDASGSFPKDYKINQKMILLMNRRWKKKVGFLILSTFQHIYFESSIIHIILN